MQQTVLLVDDDEELLSYIRLLLVSIDIFVLTAKNGQDALNFFSSNKIDCVLSDIYMPVMSGIELLAVLKKRGSRRAGNPHDLICRPGYRRGCHQKRRL